MGRVDSKKNEGRKSLSAARISGSSGRISKLNSNAPESTKDRISRMKEAKMKYSQISQTRAGTGRSTTVGVAPSFGGSTRMQRPKQLSIPSNELSKFAKNMTATVPRSRNGPSIRDGFKTSSASLDLIKNNKPIPTTGRVSTYGCGRVSVARPSILPGGLNYFDESNTRTDKKLIEAFMNNVAPRTPGRQSVTASCLGLGGSVDRLTGTSRNNKVRFAMEDTIKETRESEGSELGNQTPVRNPHSLENTNHSLIQSILKRTGNSISRSTMKILSGETNIQKSVGEEHPDCKTPQLRRSTRKSISIRFDSLDMVDSGGKKETTERMEEEFPRKLSPILSEVSKQKELDKSDVQVNSKFSTPTELKNGDASSQNVRRRGTFTKSAVTDISCVYSIWFAGSEEQKRTMPIDMLKKMVKDMQSIILERETIDISQLDDSENKLPLEIPEVEEKLMQTKLKRKNGSQTFKKKYFQGSDGEK